MSEINVKMKIVQRPLESLTPYKKNPRKNDAAVPATMESIRRYGFRQPIVVDKDGVIVAGHTRYRAALKLGLKTVPVVVADDLTPEQIRAYRLADNKVGELAEWDETLLAEELLLIDEEPMELFGFEDVDLNLGDDEDGAGTERKDLSDEIKEQFQVIIDCSGEAEQERLYNRLTEEGYQCRVLTL